MKKCQEEIKQAPPDKVLKPEEGKVAVSVEKVAAEKDQVPAVAQDKAKDKAEAEAKVKAEAEAKVKAEAEAKVKAEAEVKDKEEIAKKEENIMPGFDRSGPQGQGPMTGGARGLCNPAAGDIPTAYGRGFGYGAQRGGRLGLGRGFRGARGMGWRFVRDDLGYPQSDPPLSMTENQDILNKLKEGVDTMNASLSSMNQVLNDLKNRLKTSPE